MMSGFLLSIDLVSVTFYTIPTSIYISFFSEKKFLKFYQRNQVMILMLL